MDNTSNPENGVGLSIPGRLLSFLLRTFFKLLYHQLSWTYDFVAWFVSSGNWEKWTLSLVPYIHGPTVLEIGFGPGHLLLSLSQRNFQTFGIDESRQMVRMSRHRLNAHGISPNLIRGVAQSLPFADESFHNVVMTFPSEFIFNRATIIEIQRVLMQGGSALVVPLAWITGRKPFERLAAWVNRISGEAPQWNPKVLDPLKEIGFDVSWEMIEYSNSRCVLVRLNKR